MFEKVFYSFVKLQFCKITDFSCIVIIPPPKFYNVANGDTMRIQVVSDSLLVGKFWILSLIEVLCLFLAVYHGQHSWKMRRVEYEGGNWKCN